MKLLSGLHSWSRGNEQMLAGRAICLFTLEQQVAVVSDYTNKPATIAPGGSPMMKT